MIRLPDRRDLPESNPIGFWVSLWILMIGLALGLALLPQVHRQMNADGYIQSLFSTQRWLLFYWGQERFGSITPLITMPIRAPSGNWQMQLWVNSLLLFACLWAVMAQRRLQWFDGLAWLIMVWIITMGYRDMIIDLLINNYVSWSLFFSFSGLALYRRLPYRGPGLWFAVILLTCCMTLAIWANTVMPMFMLPWLAADSLLAWRRVFSRPSVDCRSVRRRWAWLRTMPITACLLSLLFPLTIAIFFNFPHSDRHLVSFSTWTTGVLICLRHLIVVLLTNPWFAGLLAGGVLVGFIRMRMIGQWRWFNAKDRRVMIQLPAVNLIYVAFVGIMQHFYANDCHVRYLYPVLLLDMAVIVQWLVRLVCGRWSVGRVVRRWLVMGSAGLLIISLLIVAEYQGDAGPGAIDQQRWGSDAAYLRAQQVSHVAGGYFECWPIVWYLNALAYESEDYQPVYGLLARCRPTVELWQQIPIAHIRIAWRKACPSDATDVGRFDYDPATRQLTLTDTRVPLLRESRFVPVHENDRWVVYRLAPH